MQVTINIWFLFRKINELFRCNYRTHPSANGFGIREIKKREQEGQNHPGVKGGVKKNSLRAGICEHLEYNIVILILLITVFVDCPYKT